MGLDFLLRLGVFEDELGPVGHTFFQDNHAAGGADGVRVARDRFRPIGKVHVDGNADKDALGAAALFGRGLAVLTRTDVCGPGLRAGLGMGQILQSSIPQKSISGAMSSTPYSQPSGRELPFQTMTAALLVPLERLVRAMRWSR